MKWRRKRRVEEQAGGEDSFLDIVANLVGILVILVMVIGVRAQEAWVESSEETPAVVPDGMLRQRDQTVAEHDSLTRQLHETKQRAANLAKIVASRQQERHQLQVLLTAARIELDERRQELSEDQQYEVVAATEVKQIEDELSRVEAQRRLLESEAQNPIELEHLPTPLARTVFGNEEHFRLKNRRLVYVPLNELTEILKREIPQKIHRLQEIPQFTETIGPVQGFHLRYTMLRRSVATTTQVGAIVRQVAELDQFQLLPMSDDLGEPLDQALGDGSQFRQLLAAMRPGNVVITVWTYPDSYGDYRKLKKWLYERGYSSAARPLPEGQPISGSPRGSRSAAQ